MRSISSKKGASYVWATHNGHISQPTYSILNEANSKPLHQHISWATHRWDPGPSCRTFDLSASLATAQRILSLACRFSRGSWPVIYFRHHQCSHQRLSTLQRFALGLHNHHDVCSLRLSCYDLVLSSLIFRSHFVKKASTWSRLRPNGAFPLVMKELPICRICPTFGECWANCHASKWLAPLLIKGGCTSA